MKTAALWLLLCAPLAAQTLFHGINQPESYGEEIHDVSTSVDYTEALHTWPPMPTVCIYNVDVWTPSGHVTASSICVQSWTGLPIHPACFGGGVFFYDDAGYVYYPYLLTPWQSDVGIREFANGVH